jgi:organic hydroperoxide reductase OsmC/OhrA
MCGTGIDSQPSENERSASSRNPTGVALSSAMKTAVIVGMLLPSRNSRASAASSSAVADGQRCERNVAHASESSRQTERTRTPDGFRLIGKGPFCKVKTHTYKTQVQWTPHDGQGTTSYRSYRRDHAISVEGKVEIPASSDPTFRGDATRYNPEELLVASLSSCHMLWYLHLCATNGVTVLDYADNATGTMEENPDGSGQFARVDLRPNVTIAPGSDRDRALALNDKAHHLCFIARSVNFPVKVEAEITYSPKSIG